MNEKWRTDWWSMAFRISLYNVLHASQNSSCNKVLLSLLISIEVIGTVVVVVAVVVPDAISDKFATDDCHLLCNCKNLHLLYQISQQQSHISYHCSKG